MVVRSTIGKPEIAEYVMKNVKKEINEHKRKYMEVKVVDFMQMKAMKRPNSLRFPEY